MKKIDSYDSILLDLDETIYPKANGLWAAMSERINQFIIECLHISPKEAEELRHRYLTQYGTTLMGLSIERNINPYDYLEFVHDIPLEEYLVKDPNLYTMLENISAKRIIFTNASAAHAHRICSHLEITDLIDQVIDIIALDFINKPNPAAYQKAIGLGEISDPASCIMVDDRVENLFPAWDLGMTTVWIGDGGGREKIDYHMNSILELVDVIPGLLS